MGGDGEKGLVIILKKYKEPHRSELLPSQEAQKIYVGSTHIK